jgi:lipopolysaccharide export system permease protein
VGPRILDRYVAREFLRIFFITALGFPIFTILISITDNIDKYLARGIPASRILAAYVYQVPEQVFFIIPAAVLFATVFSVGGFARHAELTAAKASGISFHRLVLPVIFLAIGASGLTWLLGEITPISNERYAVMVGDKEMRSQSGRYSFVYRADGGRTYAIRSLNVPMREIRDIQVEREGTGPEFPGYFLTASLARHDSARGWTMEGGTMRFFMGDESEIAMSFDTVYQRAFTERPEDLLTEPKAPDQMTWAELGHYIRTLERSGNNANKLRVERALKIAIPVTCIVIALFGAPLAITGPRAGAAYGVAVSLATTIVFLMMVQISKAVGAGGVLPPLVAAWIPNAAFGLSGLILFSRART